VFSNIQVMYSLSFSAASEMSESYGSVENVSMSRPIVVVFISSEKTFGRNRRPLFQSQSLGSLIVLRACGEPGELTYLLHNQESYKNMSNVAGV
jgi:hypothetical protein